MPDHSGEHLPLVTTRLRLVPQTAAAVRALVEGRDPGLPLAEGYPHAATLDGLRLGAHHDPAQHTGDDVEPGGWFIVLTESGAVIGDCGAKGSADERGRVEIGYGLAAPFRGRGYGGEAVAALVGWLLEDPRVRTVTAEVEVGNLASRRLLERLGFSLEDTDGGSWWLALPGPPGPPGPPP